MITLTREEAQQILDALGSCEEDWIYDGEDEHPVDVYDKEKVGKAFALLKNRLSAPEPEPVAGYRWEEGRTPPSVTYTAPLQREEGCAECGKKSSDGWALYCVKCSEREWQGLTDEEMQVTVDEIAIDAGDSMMYLMGSFARAIEAKLKEKNA
jgi:hypothetical protein